MPADNINVKPAPAISTNIQSAMPMDAPVPAPPIENNFDRLKKFSHDELVSIAGFKPGDCHTVKAANLRRVKSRIEATERAIKLSVNIKQKRALEGELESLKNEYHLIEIKSAEHNPSEIR